MQPKRKSNAELRKETRIILAYIEQQHEDIMDIYAKARAAKIRYFEDDYYFTDTDRDSIIMLASAFSAILRRTYKLFVTEQGFEPTSFWDAYIQLALFRQHVMFDETWGKIFGLDKKLSQLIKKTSNPNFIEKIFTGDISLKWLQGELGSSIMQERPRGGRGGLLPGEKEELY